jgi:4-hydroxy-tetrahydrodipicolinate synthase
MAQSSLKGVIAAIATPITEKGDPDHERFVKLARHLLDNGCDGLNVLGTTGEATSFTSEQRMGLMSSVAKSGLPLRRMMVGTGAAAIGDAIRLTRHAAETGFAGALVLPPFYYKGVSDEGVVNYIGGIVDAVFDIPIYLYNYPALSGVPYTPILVGALLKRFGERIKGLKDSSGDLAYARQVAALSRQFDVFPSSEAALLEARTGIFAGCISATANVNSDLCARAFHDGDEEASARAVAIRNLFNGLPLVGAIKSLLASTHGDAAIARMKPPLVTLPSADQAKLRAGYDRLRG